MIKRLILTASALSVMPFLPAMAQESSDGGVPTLVVTNRPIAELVGTQQASPMTPPAASMQVQRSTQQTAMRSPGGMSADLYRMPRQVNDITAERVLGTDYFEPVDTMAAQKVVEIQNDMYALQGQVADAAEQLVTLETVGQDLSANYYAAVATINTQLQSGTTPGNPRLKNRLVLAEDALDTLSGNIADLNVMAVKIADLASVGKFLQQQARSAYGLSGSIEEDHANLAQLEDEIANTSVAIERLLNNVNDNITRAAAYMASERANLRTLSLAVANGDLYGKSLSTRPFSMAQGTNIMNEVAYSQANDAMMRSGVPVAGMPQNMNVPMAMPQQAMGMPASPRPLMKIRFDRPDVDFSQALYMSVSEALQRYPNSEFELVAVSPGMGNPAKLAIESTKARRNAEKVLRNMVQMGVDTNRVNLANLTEDDIQFNEVHLYIR